MAGIGPSMFIFTIGEWTLGSGPASVRLLRKQGGPFFKDFGIAAVVQKFAKFLDFQGVWFGEWRFSRVGGGKAAKK